MNKRNCKRLTDWDWTEIQTYYNDKHSLAETVKEFNLSRVTILKANKRGLFVSRSIESSKLLRGTKGCGKPITNYDWAVIQSYYDNNHSTYSVIREFNLNHAIVERAIKLGLFVSRTKLNKPATNVLKESSSLCKPITDWDWPVIQAYYDNNHSAAEVIKEFGLNFTAISKANKLGLFISRTRYASRLLRGTTGRGIARTAEQRARISASMQLAVKEGRQRTLKPYGIVAIPYKGIILQSQWELKVAIFLDSRNILWERPTKSFDYTFEDKVLQYFPDFYLTDYNLYIEVKGWTQAKDLCKWRDFPDKLLIIDRHTINCLDTVNFN